MFSSVDDLHLWQSVTNVLTCQKNSELLVVELRLLLGEQAALGAMSHRVDETHAGQHHLLTAALIAETPTAPPAVMLQETTTLITDREEKMSHHNRGTESNTTPGRPPSGEHRRYFTSVYHFFSIRRSFLSYSFHVFHLFQCYLEGISSVQI